MPTRTFNGSTCLAAFEPRRHHAAAPLASPAADALFEALLGAGSRLVELTPELSRSPILARHRTLPPGLLGAFVPVQSSEGRFQVGLLADACSCDLLGALVQRTLRPRTLGARAALCTLAFELGTTLARELAPTHNLRLGPPRFVDGLAHRARADHVRAAEVTLGGIRGTLALADAIALAPSDWPGRIERPSRR